MTRLEKKKQFIKALAEFFGGPMQCEKSILLGINAGKATELAKEWAKLRGLTPLSGYPTVKEAEEVLTEFLC